MKRAQGDALPEREMNQADLRDRGHQYLDYLRVVILKAKQQRD